MKILRLLIPTLVMSAALMACGGGGGAPPGGGGPIVQITAPPYGASVTEGDTVTVQAAAADPGGVTRVELLIDNQLVNTQLSPNPGGSAQLPATLTWQAAGNGAHTLTVRATNNANRTGTASQPIAVNPRAGAQATGAAIPTVVALATDTLPTATTGEALTDGAPTAAAPATETGPTAAANGAPTPNDTNCTYNSLFAGDVTIPDGTRMPPGQAFTKTWNVKNTGTCAWTDGFTLNFVSGQPPGDQPSVPLPALQPGETGQVSVETHAPNAPGSYTGIWKYKTAQGAFFGGNLTTVIVVAAPTLALPTDAPLAFLPSFDGGQNIAVDTQGDKINIGASFSNTEPSPIDHVDFAVLTPDNKTVVTWRATAEPYCYHDERDFSDCGYFDLGANGNKWHNGAPAQNGLYFARAVAYTKNNKERVAEVPFWLDLQGNNPEPQVFLNVEQTSPNDTNNRIRDALAWQVSLDNESGQKIDRIEMYVLLYEGTIVSHKTERSAPYCGFGDGNPCNIYDFAGNHFKWENGAPIGPMIVLRAVAYAGNRPVAGLSEPLEIMK